MWTRAYLCLFFFELCLQLGTQTSNPIVSNYALSLGATVVLAGTLASISAFSGLIMRALSGPLLARLPIKKLLIFFSVLFCAGSFLCTLIQDLQVLAICRVMAGVANAGKSTLIIAYAAYILPEETRGQGVAWIAICNVIGVALGPIISSFMGDHFGWRSAFFLSGVFFLLAVASSLLLKSPQVSDDKKKDAGPAEKRSVLKSFVYIGALPIAFIAVLEGVCYGTMNTLTLTVGEMRGITSISLYYVAYVTVSFAARPFSGRFYDRFGFRKVCVPMALFIFGAMIAMAFAQGPASVLVAGALFALGQGCMWPCLQAQCVKGVPPEKYSLSANTMSLGVDVGCTLGPLLGGVILSAAGATAMYLFDAAIACMLLAAIVFYDNLHRLVTNNRS